MGFCSGVGNFQHSEGLTGEVGCSWHLPPLCQEEDVDILGICLDFYTHFPCRACQHAPALPLIPIIQLFSSVPFESGFT